MLLILAMALARHRRFPHSVIFAFLLAEILLLNGIIAVNGAASNPFNAVLLVPVILAFMWLPRIPALFVWLLSVSVQLAQLIPFSALDNAHGGMSDHFESMIISFIITSAIIAIVTLYFKYQLSQREAAIQQLRERQLRNEQLLAIGTAAAQLTHEVATPVQSAQLLLEEGIEQLPATPEWLLSLQEQFNRVHNKLTDWRLIAEDIRTQRSHHFKPVKLWSEIKYLMSIARPETKIDWHKSNLDDSGELIADRTLLPALTSIIVNACDAAAETPAPKVSVSTQWVNKQWQIKIKNTSLPLNEQTMKELGQRLMPSPEGHGIGAAVSNATIEKFNGKVSWFWESECLATLVTLPGSQTEQEPGSRAETYE
ncbi:ATP-binding protein [Idiomarina aminovorans]|uniref:ATP-binding protein n=1 Tax=Idiomarina aminovorans TaxID=2914829 RepID=UPI002005EEFC|nr:ATP-binding protein [Idiomarina sp. ATCH4]MCK7460394.1 hypothetical protein [Idiomarina sp. ATCH4]